MGYIKFIICVLNCEDRVSHKHRFPANPKKDFNIYKKWLEVLKNQILINMDPIYNNIIYNKYGMFNLY